MNADKPISADRPSLQQLQNFIKTKRNKECDRNNIDRDLTTFISGSQMTRSSKTLHWVNWCSRSTLHTRFALFSLVFCFVFVSNYKTDLQVQLSASGVRQHWYPPQVSSDRPLFVVAWNWARLHALFHALIETRRKHVWSHVWSKRKQNTRE